jgi:hypothetical protein
VKSQESSYASGINDASLARPVGGAFANQGQVESIGVLWDGIPSDQ